MARPRNWIRRARRGAQAIEFGLIFPVLLIITAGIIDWSWYYSNHLTMLHAMREGMRLGASGDSDTSDAVADTEAAILAEFDAMGWTGVSISASLSEDNDVCMVQATVSLNATTLWGLVPSSSTHSATERMRMEDQDHCDGL
jgi:Flp pilus assembly protein TadG